MDSKRRLTLLILACLLPPLYLTLYAGSDFKLEPPRSPEDIWVSMSVCYDKTEQKHHKKNFPYLLATELSVSLWRNLTRHQVLVQVLSSNEDGEVEKDQGLLKFRDRLIDLGARVELVPADPGLGSCVLQAQLQRAFAFMLPYVPDSAVVATSDVDLFPLSPSVLSPLLSPAHDTWVSQYDTTLAKGLTFGMSFLAMRARDWRALFLGARSPGEIISARRDYLTSNFEVWNYDQVLVSRLVLEQGRCFLPPENPLWLDLGVVPVETPADDRCHKGEGGKKICNRDMKGEEALGGCAAWHFHPYERERELRAKFEEVLGVRTPPGAMQKTMEEVRLEMAKILGFRN